MACKNVCRLCKRLILSNTVTYASGVLTIDIPAGSYSNGEKYCIVIAQPIPTAAIISAPVVISIGGAGGYALVTKCCAPVLAGSIRTRTKYSTTVVTTPTGGSFKLLGDICNDCTSDKAALP